MRVLWLTNQVPANISAAFDMKMPVTGGWLSTSIELLSKENELHVLFPIDTHSNVMVAEMQGIIGYGVPMDKGLLQVNKKVVETLKQYVIEIQPDIVHIWGTEYLHSYMMLLALRSLGMLNKVVVSIQGLVSVCERHFYGHIQDWRTRIPTLKDLYFKEGLSYQKKIFYIRGKYEKEVIKLSKYIIGRTDWDHACVLQINPNVKYFFCNEILRESFYHKHWEIDKCKRHTIFMSQCAYPIKGLHHMLEALSILRKKWDDVHLNVIGRDITIDNWKERLLDNSYDKYNRKLIQTYGLNKYVSFLPLQEEEEMCNCFLKSNVFVIASSIENSPNSLGEAMLLGVPCVVADVGGVKNMLKHEEEGFVYQSDAPYMLAYYIDKFFENDELAVQYGSAARKHAKKTHNQHINNIELQKIYREILEVGEEK